MTAVIQRVLEASVTINNELFSSIGKGLLILVGVKTGDDNKIAELTARKIIDLRIFNDMNDKMNLSVKDVDGEILVVSQFTLCTDNDKGGNRPAFTEAEAPDKAERIYLHHVEEMKKYYNFEKIKTGLFAVKMEVRLINDGPVTIILEKNKCDE
ncbi:MAG: D-aminoacyl-tRNA deacylase [Ignavibacteria bacterium]